MKRVYITFVDTRLKVAFNECCNWILPKLRVASSNLVSRLLINSHLDVSLGGCSGFELHGRLHKCLVATRQSSAFHFNKMASKEATARIKINKLIEEAGWRFFDSDEGKANIVLEPNVKLTTGRISALGDLKA